MDWNFENIVKNGMKIIREKLKILLFLFSRIYLLYLSILLKLKYKNTKVNFHSSLGDNKIY
jgi:hypothetical protein